MEIKQFLLWLPMVVIAFVNGTLREFVIAKHFSGLRAHQLSTVTLIVFCTIYIWFASPALNLQNARQALLVGFVWVILTVAFEFILGRLSKKSWEYLLRDYNLLAGHIWPIFLLMLFLLPYLCYILRNRQ